MNKSKKGKVSAKGAKMVANFMKGKAQMPPKAAPVDAEDMVDGGADEATEKS